jgi:hypothetical protein
MVNVIAPLMVVLALAAPIAAQPEPGVLSEAAVIERDAAVEVWVRLSRPVKYQSALMDGPWRLVFDFEGTDYRWTKRPVPVGIGPVRELRGSQYRQGIARLVIELQRKVDFTVERDREGLRIVLPREAVAMPVQPRAAAAPGAPLPAPAVSGTPPPAPVTPAPAKPAPITPAPAKPVPAGPRVHGIIMLDEQAHAYIFDPATKEVRRYAVGDAFGNGVVEAIAEKRVVLRMPSGRVELRVEDLKPPPAAPPPARPR